MPVQHTDRFKPSQEPAEYPETPMTGVFTVIHMARRRMGNQNIKISAAENFIEQKPGEKSQNSQCHIKFSVLIFPIIVSDRASKANYYQIKFFQVPAASVGEDAAWKESFPVFKIFIIKLVGHRFFNGELTMITKNIDKGYIEGRYNIIVIVPF